jgi:hypothetical protein
MERVTREEKARLRDEILMVLVQSVAIGTVFMVCFFIWCYWVRRLAMFLISLMPA